MKNIVLCITHSKDFYTIDRVMDELKCLGYRPIRVNGDTYPMHWQMTLEMTSVSQEVHFVTEEARFSSREIAAVWLRKNATSTIDFGTDQSDSELDKQLSQCTVESESAKLLCLNRLSEIPWIDNIESIRTGEDKGFQLAVASDVGISIPDTLISNCPQAVTAFYQKHQGNIVAKLLQPLTRSMNRPKEFVYTSRVKEEHLAHLDGLQYAPMVFQNEINKAFELRVAYVDGQCFCGKIDTSDASVKTKVDWRQAEQKEFSWQHHELDSAIAGKLGNMMRKMNLVFGAIDIIVSPEGEHVFLEVNPVGEWGMLEKDLSLPISKAISQALDKRIKALSSHESSQNQL